MMKRRMFIPLIAALTLVAAACGGVQSDAEKGIQPGPEPGAASSPQPLLGFKGPDGYYLEKVTTDEGVIVLENSITTTEEGNWRAWGLIQNATPQDVGEIVVTATLYDETGAVLDNPSSEIGINPLRSGEPAPFALQSEVEAAKVARVEWSTQTGAVNPRGSRAIDVLIYYQVPYGVSEWKGSDRGQPPYPHVVAAGLDNQGAPLESANLAMAWVDDGRVVWVETTTLDADGLKLPIPTGGAANFRQIQILDDQMEVYHRKHGELYLYRLQYLAWAWGNTASE